MAGKDVNKNTSGTKPEIRSEKSTLQPIPTPQLKVANSMPNVLEVKFEPSSCSETIVCELFGGNINFEVEFKLHREHYDEHLLKVGLKSGKLQLNLGALQKKWLKPKIKILPTVAITEEMKSLYETILSIKTSHFSKSGSKTLSVESIFVRISSGGTPERPYWFFEALEGHLLEGIVEDLVCKIIPTEKICCKCGYEFIVEPGDWSFDYSFDQHFGKLNTYFARLQMREIAIRRIMLYNHVAEQDKYIISRGKWKCPVDKKTRLVQKK